MRKYVPKDGMNSVLMMGAILGLTSVMMGAYLDHAETLSQKSLESLLTASRYHQVYAIVITILGLNISSQPSLKKWLSRSAYIFITGICLFSGGIYASLLWGYPAMVYLTPIGGTTLMLGWISLMLIAFLL